MAQLKMYLRVEACEYPEMTNSLKYRRFNDTTDDKNLWYTICKSSLLRDDEGIEAYERRMLSHDDFHPQDIFFVMLDGKEAATITAIIHPKIKMGYVHMVGALPECRGLGIGTYMNKIACARFYEAGCIGATLTTDEFRIPAIKSYLKAGFMPVEYDEGMTERWTVWLLENGYSNVPMVNEKGEQIKVLCQG